MNDNTTITEQEPAPQTTAFPNVESSLRERLQANGRRPTEKPPVKKREKREKKQPDAKNADRPSKKKASFATRKKKEEMTLEEARAAAAMVTDLPEYSLTTPSRLIRWKLLIPIILAVLLIAAVYLPPLMLERPAVGYHSVPVAANTAALKELADYQRNAIKEDFDGDGLTNEQEITYGTGVYTVDHDGDGVTDYAELYITDSNPAIYDNEIISFVQQADSLSGNKANTPFKDDGVILWADDYASKARGAVASPYQDVYKITDFRGWIQLPERYRSAYKMDNAFQAPLKQNADGYFYVDASDAPVYIHAYKTQPEECIALSILTTDYKLPKNAFTKALKTILPSNGFGLLVCRDALASDFEGAAEEARTVAPIVCNTAALELKETRFSRNCTKPTDLQDIKDHIDNNQPVLLSLMSSTRGEAIVEVYGYTSRNNLIVCDPLTTDPLGVIAIDLSASRLLDASGIIMRHEFFTFTGCGFTSATRDRLAILTYLANEELDPEPPVEEDPIPEETEPATEPPTEPPTEPEPTEPPLPEDPVRDAVLYPTFGSLKKEFLNADVGRYMRYLSDCTQADFDAHLAYIVDTLQFNAYRCTDGSTETFSKVIVCDSAHNIATLTFNAESGEFTTRYEAADKTPTTELLPEYFLTIAE